MNNHPHFRVGLYNLSGAKAKWQVVTGEGFLVSLISRPGVVPLHESITVFMHVGIHTLYFLFQHFSPIHH